MPLEGRRLSSTQTRQNTDMIDRTGRLRLHRAHEDAAAASTSPSSRRFRPLPPVPRRRQRPPVLAGIPPSSAATQQIRPAVFVVDVRLSCTVAGGCRHGRRPRTVATATVLAGQQRERRPRPLPSSLLPRPPSPDRRRRRRRRDGGRSSEVVGYPRSGAERRTLRRRCPPVYPGLVEERFHRRWSTVGLDCPHAAVPVDTEIPAAMAAPVGSPRRRRR